MADTTVIFGLALLAGGILPTCPWPTAAAAIASVVLMRERAARWVWGAALGAMAVGAWRAGAAVARFDGDRSEVRALLGGPVRCAAEATVVSSPTCSQAKPASLARAAGDGAEARASSGEAPPEMVPSWEADLTGVECEGRALARGFRARLHGGPDDLARGDRVEVIAGFAPAQLFRNEDLGDPRPARARRAVLASGGVEDVRWIARSAGLYARIDRFRARVRRRIEATFARDAAPMARALVLGESDLDEGDDRAFRASGLSHLLAVSGTHLVVVVVGAVGALTALLKRVLWASARWDVGRWGAAGGIALAWLYADFAGASGSANRAAAMLSWALLARALGRRPHGPRAFGLSLVGAALVDPLVAFDTSFLLSVAATGGLMVLQRPIGARLEAAYAGVAARRPRAKPALDWLSSAVATTLAATIGCAPLIAFMAPTLPLGGVPANVLAVPLGELIALPLCLAHALSAALPGVERGGALVASGSLLLVRGLARATERIGWLAFPVPKPTAWQCALLWGTAVACWCGARRRWSHALVGAALLAVVEVGARREGVPRGVLRITVLDVAQGDASIIDFPDGRAMLVDAGGLVGSPIDTGKAVVAPVLRARRRSSLAAAVLSHPHPDHFGGLGAALADLAVGELWDTGQGEAEGAGPIYAALLRDLRGRGVAVVRPSQLCGRPRAFGGATVEALSPCPEPVPFANANDNSFVLRVAYGRRAALLVGDAEHAAEDALLATRRASLRVDFLKVGHHGSATSSTPAFLEAVRPADAAISCGVRNRFGHPHPKALAALSAAAAVVHRTDLHGSIRWETDGDRVTIAHAVESSTAPGRGL